MDVKWKRIYTDVYSDLMALLNGTSLDRETVFKEFASILFALVKSG